MGYPQLSPLSQKLQYNKQDRTVPRCSLAQAEPRSQYIQLDYMVYFCSVRLKQKFFFYTISPLDRATAKRGTLAALFPYIWSHSPVDSGNLLQHKAWLLLHRSYSTIPYLTFDEAIPLYARCCIDHG